MSIIDSIRRMDYDIHLKDKRVTSFVHGFIFMNELPMEEF